MRSFAIAAALISATFVAAKDIPVIVGGNDELKFDPSSVVASNGDTITFQFVSKNHTVTQSTFQKPCERMSTPQQGVDSGFMPVDKNAANIPAWSFTVMNDSVPIWFYCRQESPVSHCLKGMVFAVNPTAEKSFDAFQKIAMGAAANGTTTNSTTSAGGSGNGSSSSTGSASGGAGGATNTGGSAATPTNTSNTGNNAAGNTGGNNGAMSVSMNAAGLVSIAGLAVGLLL